MELTAEIKLLGDGYAGGFSCGMSTFACDTARGFKKTDTENISDEKVDVYKDDRGLVLKVHDKKDGEARRVFSEFINGGTSEVSLEMFASFALKNVKADKIHRLLSFWSAEGKLKTETITDLHLEKSWNG